MHTLEESTDTLNKLLRGEMSAVETYHQALEKVGDETGAASLRDIALQHQEAVDTLRRHVIDRGGHPDADSGVWGGWAKAVMGTAKLFGNQAAWQALKQGEEHGISLYENALKDDRLPSECKDLIRTRLLPAQRRHVSILETIQNIDSRT
jgi:uncharacterized protein (TIGR02284 family)